MILETIKRESKLIEIFLRNLCLFWDIYFGEKNDQYKFEIEGNTRLSEYVTG